MSYKIYHNPRCSKSRLGLDTLQSTENQIEIVDYMKTGFTANELKQIFMKLNKTPKEMIRTHEDLYKEKFKDKNFTDEEWLQIIAENPKLLQRPIVLDGNKGVLANPVENLIEFLKK